jgi:hypothetical protein
LRNCKGRLRTARRHYGIFERIGERNFVPTLGGTVDPVAIRAVCLGRYSGGANVIELIGPAFAIEMLGAIASSLSAVVADGMAGTRHDPNQELIGRGLPIRSRRSSADSRRPARLRGRRRISATAGRVR